MTTPRIKLPNSRFEPWVVTPVTHDLCEHPLLQLDKLRELGSRLDAQNQVRSHSAAAEAGTSFHDAPKIHPTKKSASDMLADVAAAQAWMSLLNVQTDPVYRTLVDEVLDSVKPLVDVTDPGMSYRGGWIFITSPGAITPYHIDAEHNFLVQLQGRKRVYIWDPMDREVVSEAALERFHGWHSRDLVTFAERMKERAMVFDLEPGQGAFMPSTSPHMVENGDGPSVTMSFTFYTDSTRRRRAAYQANFKLRRLGLTPPPIGETVWRDQLMSTAMTALSGGKMRLKKLVGRSIDPPTAAYAPHLFS